MSLYSNTSLTAEPIITSNCLYVRSGKVFRRT